MDELVLYLKPPQVLLFHPEISTEVWDSVAYCCKVRILHFQRTLIFRSYGYRILVFYGVFHNHLIVFLTSVELYEVGALTLFSLVLQRTSLISMSSTQCWHTYPEMLQHRVPPNQSLFSVMTSVWRHNNLNLLTHLVHGNFLVEFYKVLKSGHAHFCSARFVASVHDRQPTV